MANEKMIFWISTINRALGMIEGIAYSLENSAAECLEDAVQMIDSTVKEMQENGG